MVDCNGGGLDDVEGFLLTSHGDFQDDVAVF